MTTNGGALGNRAFSLVAWSMTIGLGLPAACATFGAAPDTAPTTLEGGADAAPHAPAARFSAPRVLASGQSRPHWIALDRDAIYWHNEGALGQSELKKLLRLGDAGVPISLAGENAGRLLLIDSGNLYWSFRSATCGLVAVTPKSDALGARSGCVAVSVNIAQDATSIYQNPAEELRLYRLPKSLTTASFDELPEIGTSVAVDGVNVYVGSARSTIYWAPKFATPLAFKPFAVGQASPVAMVADGGALYWITDPGGDVATLAASSPEAKPTTLASRQQNPTAIAVDSSHVYWTNAGDGTVMRVPKTGGEPEVIATGQRSPAGIAVDDTAAVWANVDDGTVMMATR